MEAGPFRVSDSWSPEHALLPDGDAPDVSGARTEREATEGAFATHTSTPPLRSGTTKRAGNLDLGGLRGQSIFPGVAGTGEDLGGLWMGPVDGSGWRGSSNNAPTLHMKELGRLAHPGFPLWICTATYLGRLRRGRRLPTSKRHWGRLGEESPSTKYLPSAGIPVLVYSCEFTVCNPQGHRRPYTHDGRGQPFCLLLNRRGPARCPLAYVGGMKQFCQGHDWRLWISVLPGLPSLPPTPSQSAHLAHFPPGPWTQHRPSKPCPGSILGRP